MLLIPTEEDGYSFKNKIKGYHLPFNIIDSVPEIIDP